MASGQQPKMVVPILVNHDGSEMVWLLERSIPVERTEPGLPYVTLEGNMVFITDNSTQNIPTTGRTESNHIFGGPQGAINLAQNALFQSSESQMDLHRLASGQLHLGYLAPACPRPSCLSSVFFLLQNLLPPASLSSDQHFLRR